MPFSVLASKDIGQQGFSKEQDQELPDTAGTFLIQGTIITLPTL